MCPGQTSIHLGYTEVKRCPYGKRQVTLTWAHVRTYGGQSLMLKADVDWYFIYLDSDRLTFQFGHFGLTHLQNQKRERWSPRLRGSCRMTCQWRYCKKVKLGLTRRWCGLIWKVPAPVGQRSLFTRYSTQPTQPTVLNSSKCFILNSEYWFEEIGEQRRRRRLPTFQAFARIYEA